MEVTWNCRGKWSVFQVAAGLGGSSSVFGFALVGFASAISFAFAGAWLTGPTSAGTAGCSQPIAPANSRRTEGSFTQRARGFGRALRMLRAGDWKLDDLTTLGRGLDRGQSEHQPFDDRQRVQERGLGVELGVSVLEDQHRDVDAGERAGEVAEF